MTALDHREPDRLPRDLWAGAEVSLRLQQHFGQANRDGLMDRWGADLRYVEGPSYVGQQFRTHQDGSIEDLWGVRRETKHLAHGPYAWQYRHVKVSPLADMTTAAQIDTYDHWPSADWWDYSTITADCDRYASYAIVNAGDRLDRTAQLKPMMYLRGMEQTYVDLALNPQITDAIIAHIRDYFLQYNRLVFQAAQGKLDIFMMGDDFGTQTGPMMSVDTWRRFFKDGFRAYIELAHEYGLKVMHHTCGSVVELIPDFIECGLDILQSLQPRARGMDLAFLKREYGRDLCFHGGVDIQHTLVNGSADEIRQMVRRLARNGKPDGGYIISTAHNIPPETPTDNILTLLSAYDEFAAY